MKKGFWFVIITALVFSLFEPVGKMVGGEINPVAITFLRFLIGGAMLLPLSLHSVRKKQIRLTAKDHLVMAGLGALLICFSMVVLQYAIEIGSSPSLNAIVFSVNSVITIMLSALVFRDRVTPTKIAAVILCMLGIVICSFRQLQVTGGALSIILTLIAALSFSVYTIACKKLLTRLDVYIQMGFSFLYGSLFLLIYLLARGISPVDGLSMQNLKYILVLGIIVTGIGYLSYLSAIQYGSTLLASFAFFVKPVLAPFISYALLGTDLSVEVFIGLLFVLAGSFLANYYDKIIAPAE